MTFEGKTFQDQAGKLKKTGGPAPGTAPKQDDAGIKAMVALWSECAGDLKTVAKRTACDERLLRKNPPKDANDFAVKMLAGAYAADDGMHS